MPRLYISMPINTMFRYLWLCLILLWSCQSSEQSADTATGQVKPTEHHQEVDQAPPSRNNSVPEATIKKPPKSVSTEKKTKSTKAKAGLKQPKIRFVKTSYDFGEIYHADKVTHQFEFVNEGKRDLEIVNAKASCGCTTPSYPFLPIAPGEKGFIGVTYNSVGKQGFQRANIRVRTNDPNQEEIVLKLKGRVKVKPKAEYEAEQAAKRKKQES